LAQQLSASAPDASSGDAQASMASLVPDADAQDAGTGKTDKRALLADSTETLASSSASQAATATATASEKTSAAGATDVIGQIQRVTDMMANRVSGSVSVSGQQVQAKLKLTPPELGSVSVTLQIQADSSVQAQIVADNPDAAKLIRDNIGQLQEGLTRQGLTVGSIQVSVQGASSSASSQNANGSWSQSSQNGQQAREQAQERQASQNEDQRRQAGAFSDEDFS
jgi:flagellar hook-length control protein FliK